MTLIENIQKMTDQATLIETAQDLVNRANSGDIEASKYVALSLSSDEETQADAVEWLSHNVQLGDVESMYYLGMLHLNGTFLCFSLQ